MSSSTRDCKSHPAPLRGGEEVGAHAPAVRGRAALVVGAPIAGAHGRVGAGRHDDVLGVGHTVAVPVTCGPVAFDEVGFGQPVGGGSGPDRARGARAPRRQRRPRRRTGRRGGAGHPQGAPREGRRLRQALQLAVRGMRLRRHDLRRGGVRPAAKALGCALPHGEEGVARGERPWVRDRPARAGECAVCPRQSAPDARFRAQNAHRGPLAAGGPRIHRLSAGSRASKAFRRAGEAPGPTVRTRRRDTANPLLRRAGRGGSHSWRLVGPVGFEPTLQGL